MTKHIHKLKRYAYKNGEKVYFCVVDDCKYKIVVGMALGKKTICNRCGIPFIMNELSIRMAKPHCNACIRKKNEELDTTRSISFDKDGPNSPIVANIINDPIADLRKSLLKSIGDTLEDTDKYSTSRVDTAKVEDDIL